MDMKAHLLPLFLLCGCPHPSNGGSTGTNLSLHNTQAAKAIVYVSFGSDSEVTADDWAFCNGSHFSCSFEMAAGEIKPIANDSGSYVNATFAFNTPVGCGATKAEVNINNPKWYDILDVSLVDGYSNNIEIVHTPTGEAPITLGPPNGADGNEEVLGVFPLGCDLCVQRGNPPCGMSAGPIHADGCKTKGTQYDPQPPCQYQGSKKGGGDATVQIVLK